MDERTALGRSRQVGILTFAIGSVLLRRPRLGRVAGLNARDTRAIALLDLVVAPGLIWGRPRRPWLFARAGANVGIAAILLRRRSRVGRAIAAGLAVATASDLRLTAALGEEASGGAARSGASAGSSAPSSLSAGPGSLSLSARLDAAVADRLNDRGIYLGRRSTKVHVAIYRRSGGRVGGVAPGWPEAKIALVDHRGAKSGVVRTSPLVYRADGESLAIIASKAGQPSHPAWFHNLMANPETTVQIGREVRPVRARLATEAESERFWPEFIAAYPSYATYRERAHPRVIPIVILDPRD
jgi:deazaflavin-dependent oxidoreductase (nitroreductase family)